MERYTSETRVYIEPKLLMHMYHIWSALPNTQKSFQQGIDIIKMKRPTASSSVLYEW